jgi:hypothetical protein
VIDEKVLVECDENIRRDAPLRESKDFGKNWEGAKFHLNGAPVTVVGATPKTSASLGESIPTFGFR